MSRMWNEYTSLDAMQQQIGDIFQNQLGGGRLICDVFKPDPQDFELLYQKVLMVNNTELFMEYPLAFITVWALSFKYGKDFDFNDIRKSNIGAMPQHHARLITEYFVTTCYDYNIYTNGIAVKTLNDIRKIIKMQHE